MTSEEIIQINFCGLYYLTVLVYTETTIHLSIGSLTLRGGSGACSPRKFLKKNTQKRWRQQDFQLFIIANLFFIEFQKVRKVTEVSLCQLDDTNA